MSDQNGSVSVSVFACVAPGCKATGAAEKMWNVKGKAGQREMCGRHSFEARKRGVITFRLDKTLRWEAEMAAKRLAEKRELDAFFGRLKAGGSSSNRVWSSTGNGRGQKQGRVPSR